MNGPLGSEPAVQWLNGFGFPRADWQNRLDPPAQLHPDDAVWPSDLQNHLFFRRRGSKLTDEPDERGFVRGDFGDMRQLVVEYDATKPGQEALRARYGVTPVLSILIRAHQYLMARYDFDGFRIDTVKYVHPEAIETFGNAMREFALTLGKNELLHVRRGVRRRGDDRHASSGRNGGSGEGFGIDAALDFPAVLQAARRGQGAARRRRDPRVFVDRKRAGSRTAQLARRGGPIFRQLSRQPRPARADPASRHTAANRSRSRSRCCSRCRASHRCITAPSRACSGTVDADGNPDLTANESIREALWGKPQRLSTRPAAAFVQIQALAAARQHEPPLSYGRLYFREVSGNGVDFGHSSGAGGLVAFSRILVDREILIVANTGAQPFAGAVLVDRDINATPRQMRVAYSNLGTNGAGTVRRIQNAMFHAAGQVTAGTATALDVILAPSEVQVLAPA